MIGLGTPLDIGFGTPADVVPTAADDEENVVPSAAESDERKPISLSEEELPAKGLATRPEEGNCWCCSIIILAQRQQESVTSLRTTIIQPQPLHPILAPL